MRFDALGVLTDEPAVPPAPEDGLDAFYSRIQRFAKGDEVPTWLRRVEPPDPHTKVLFFRDCEVLSHGPGKPVTLWPVVGFRRTEPRLYFEAKNLADGHALVGECEFFTQQRS